MLTQKLVSQADKLLGVGFGDPEKIQISNEVCNVFCLCGWIFAQMGAKREQYKWAKNESETQNYGQFAKLAS